MPKPIREPHESLIKINYAAICNTDREVMSGYKNFKGILGHEFTGVAVESDEEALIGRRVVGELNLGCGKCEYCVTGQEKHCNVRNAVGISGKDGCFAEYLTLPTRLLHIIPDGMPDETAIFTEPLAAAVNAVTQSGVKEDESALILGDGRLAYMIYLALLGKTPDISVLGLSADKLKTFSNAEKLTETDRKYNVVFEATGSANGLPEAITRVKPCGRIILKSTVAETTAIHASDIVVNEITVIGSRCGDFTAALKLLQNPPAPLPEIEMFPPSRFKEAFASKAFKSGFKF